MGLLEVRKSQGTFVRTLTTESLHQPLSRLSRGDAGNFLHFLDIRECMEAMTASEAARQATPEDLRQIEATLPDLRAAAARSDPEALDKADVAFHMAVVAATHSSLLIRLVDTFGNLMWSSHGLRLAILRTENLAVVCEEHAAILAAIRGRAPERARDAMMHHIQMIRDRVRGMLGRVDG
jgi:GntR family transcriptional repressor for pyruvate dehydrogenase complex